MSILDTVAAFQVINQTISGVVTAPAPNAYPATLRPESMPYAITQTTAGTWKRGRVGGGGIGGGRKVIRVYEILFIVGAPLDDPARTYPAMFALMEEVGTTYRVLTTIGSGGAQVWTEGSTDIEDLGMARIIRWGGQDYRGFPFRVPVLEPA